MLLPFKNHLREQFPQVWDSRLLVAVSGGVDSVVLTHLCKESGLEIALAHCNFHLREQESEDDEEFVLELADALNLQVFVEHFDTTGYAEDRKLSIQMAARELRYQWFEEIREAFGFDYILTAHHANDDLETFLINLVRGSGIEGFTGIPRRKDFVLRPLLPFSRASIEDFAKSERLTWREDSSNASSKYLRNKIRHEIVPVLQELNPQLLESFQKTQSHLRKSLHLIDDYIAAIFPRVARESSQGYSFDIRLLKTLPHLKAVLYELFKSFGFTEWEDIRHLLDAQSGKVVYSRTHRLIKDRKELLLTTLPTDGEAQYSINEGEEVVMLPIGTFHFEKVSEILQTDSRSIYIDKNKLSYPLQLRKWQQGDFFYPFGMEGRKKLSKFFKDNKLSLPEKENCWILCSQDRIVWVVNQRADARFSVDKETLDIIKITYIP